jgi:hypothetical protein
MRWRRRRTEGPDLSPEHVEARKALHKAKRDLKKTEISNTEILRIAEEAKDYGRRNNFTELLREAFHGAGTDHV